MLVYKLNRKKTDKNSSDNCVFDIEEVHEIVLNFSVYKGNKCTCVVFIR